jgi:uncharacterized delta-60 repeat protein
MKRITNLLLVLVFGFLAVISHSAQSGIDLSYTATPTKSGVFFGRGQIIQPDGKILILGYDLIVSGVSSGLVARLNADGSRDNSFNFCGCSFSGVNKLMLQPDGKIIVSGTHDAGPSAFNPTQRLARINADGSTDNTFTPYIGLSASSVSLTVEGIQPDGKILVGDFIDFGFGGGMSMNIIRFNPNGIRENSFSVFIGSGHFTRVHMSDLELLSDGKFYISTYSPFLPSNPPALKRYNPDGTLDSSWAAPAFSGGVVTYIDSLPNGDIVAAGGFSTVNGISRKNIVRLSSTGTVDPAFIPPSNTSSISQIEALPDGKYLILEQQTSSTGSQEYALRRLNADGSRDTTLTLASLIGDDGTRFSLDSFGRIVFAATHPSLGKNYYRLNPNGDIDGTFLPVFTGRGSISAIATQLNNKVIVVGDFTHIGSVARKGIARLEEDGTVDASFNPGSGFNYRPTKILVQPDGKILALGGGNMYQGSSVGLLVRIKSDGTLDSTFAPDINNRADSLVLQADGKIVVFGSDLVINGVSRTGIARLNADGTLDAAFNPVLDTSFVGGVVVEPNGKLTIGGAFNTVNGIARQYFARLNSDGTLDTSFNQVNALSTYFSQLVKGADGKYYIYHGNDHIIVRRHADGSVDSSFQSPVFTSDTPGYHSLNNMLPQTDGSLIVTGFFYRLTSGQNFYNRHGIVRLKRNGELDQSFIPAAVFDDSGQGVTSSVQMPNNKLLIGGDFKRVDNTERAGLARLNIVPLTQMTQRIHFDFDGDGKADVAVFRPSTGVWYRLLSGNSTLLQTTFAIAGDIPVPADYDGDGKTDLAIFRPSTGTFWYQSSINNAQIATQWGQPGDIPRPSDFDGDGKSDFIIYRPSELNWYRLGSTGLVSTKNFGSPGDKPVIGDFDGDGKSDVAVYRPSTGTWWYQSSINNAQIATQFGNSVDVPSPADFDGDGKTDFAVFRPTTGVWYVLNSGNGTATIIPFGISGDKPVAADYDGDGKSDIAVFRPSSGIWYLLQSTSGFTGLQLGTSTDMPIENAFVP